MTTPLQAIRDERAQVATRRDKAQERVDALDSQLAALDAAAAALKGDAPVNGSQPTGKRRREYRGRVAIEKRAQDVLDILRRDGRPQAAHTLAADHGIPHASAAKAIDLLLEQGKVRQIGTTDKASQPVVTFVPVKVRPGEPVTS